MGMTVGSDVKQKKVPPDGGYGWVIVFAYALNNMVLLSLFFSFGLVYKEAMSDVGLNHSQGSLVLILNSSMGMVAAFLGGPLLRRFGYRKVAVAGAVCSTLGLLGTAMASSFWMFILWYSIINSIGVGAAITSFTVALNTFFKDKRGRAIGIGMAFTGLGAILTPLLISALLAAFGWRYTVLILSAICLHSLVAACLLRPVKWYLRYPLHIQEMVPLNKDTKLYHVGGNVVSSAKEIDVEPGNAVPPAESSSMAYITDANSLQTRNTVSHSDINKSSPDQWPTQKRFNCWDSKEINLGSSINLFLNENGRTESVTKDKTSIKEEQQIYFFKKFVDFFDLTLLSDPVLVNILLGLAMAICVDNNFFVLLPIILEDLKQFETEQIARLLSIIGVTDTVFRLVTPFIGEWYKKPPRVMSLGAFLLTILVRTTMLFTSSFLSMVFIALAIGVINGFNTVYLNVVIPNYVPIQRLPFAWGIQMLANGIIGIIIGSVVGWLRESSGAYVVPLVVLNFISLCTVLLWSAEFVYFRIRNKNTN